MRTREETIAFEMNYCQHYHVDHKNRIGISCKAGMDIKDIRLPRDDKTGAFSQPCLSGHLLENATAACPHWIRRTREQGEARADRMEVVIKQLTLVGPVVAAWRNKSPTGKAEVIECPACKGRLHLSQSASNGHVHGYCETDGCARWME